MLSETRDYGAATDFFWKTLGSNGVPDRIVIDKSGANKAGLNTVNDFLYLLGILLRIEIIQAKYLNSEVSHAMDAECGPNDRTPLDDCDAIICRSRDHRFIKRLMRQMKGFKSFRAASATLSGIEVAHMIRKGQFDAEGSHAFQQFVAFAACVCPAVGLALT